MYVSDFAHAIGLYPTTHVPWFTDTHYNVRGGCSRVEEGEYILVNNFDYNYITWFCKVHILYQIKAALRINPPVPPSGFNKLRKNWCRGMLPVKTPKNMFRN